MRPAIAKAVEFFTLSWSWGGIDDDVGAGAISKTTSLSLSYI